MHLPRGLNITFMLLMLFLGLSLAHPLKVEADFMLETGGANPDVNGAVIPAARDEVLVEGTVGTEESDPDEVISFHSQPILVQLYSKENPLGDWTYYGVHLRKANPYFDSNSYLIFEFDQDNYGLWVKVETCYNSEGAEANTLTSGRPYVDEGQIPHFDDSSQPLSTTLYGIDFSAMGFTYAWDYGPQQHSYFDGKPWPIDSLDPEEEGGTSKDTVTVTTGDPFGIGTSMGDTEYVLMPAWVDISIPSEPAEVPEPATILSFLLGAAGFVVKRLKLNKQ